MTSQEKISKAKAKLMLEHPYIGALATALVLKNDSSALTFHSDGVTLTYNSEYFEKVALSEIEFALANGAMHAVLKHQERMGRRVGRIWQAATDLTVNAMLAQNGFVVPPYVYYDRRFDHMYAEEIYDILKDEMLTNQSRDEAEAESETLSPQKKSETDTAGENEEAQNRDHRSPLQAQATQEQGLAEDGLGEYFEQIFQKHKGQGTLPKGLKFVLPACFSHQLDWRELLYRYIAEFAKSSYHFMPPNKKYLYRGIYLPSLSSDLLKIVIAIDTSGSVDEETLSVFMAEISAIMQQYPNYEIDILVADAEVHSHRVFLPGEPLEYSLRGRGGTDFRPVFSYIEQHIDYPALLLYFTDGKGRFPLSAPHYDLLWVMPEPAEVPFGEVVVCRKV